MEGQDRQTPDRTKAEQKYAQVRPGDTVRVYFLALEQDRKRETVFEGTVIAHKHGSEPGATLTVRKESYGIGLEKIFPLHSPLLTRIEVVRRPRVRRAKLYFLRNLKGKKARLTPRPASRVIVSKEKSGETPDT